MTTNPYDRLWRVVVPAGVSVKRWGFPTRPGDGDLSDLLTDATGAALYPPADPAPSALDDLVDLVVNDLDCEHFGVTADQARAVIAALGGVA